MPRVIFQPTGADTNYEKTVRTPVPLERLMSHLDSDTVAKLRELYGDQPVPVWGVTPGKNNVNQPKWEKIQPDDVVIFLRKGTGVDSAKVTLKAHSRSLALDLWHAPICDACQDPLSAAEVDFCTSNAVRFAGRRLCYQCQRRPGRSAKTVSAT